MSTVYIIQHYKHDLSAIHNVIDNFDHAIYLAHNILHDTSTKYQQMHTSFVRKHSLVDFYNALVSAKTHVRVYHEQLVDDIGREIESVIIDAWEVG